MSKSKSSTSSKNSNNRFQHAFARGTAADCGTIVRSDDGDPNADPWQLYNDPRFVQLRRDVIVAAIFYARNDIVVQSVFRLLMNAALCRDIEFRQAGSSSSDKKKKKTNKNDDDEHKNKKSKTSKDADSKSSSSQDDAEDEEDEEEEQEEQQDEDVRRYLSQVYGSAAMEAELLHVAIGFSASKALMFDESSLQPEFVEGIFSPAPEYRGKPVVLDLAQYEVHYYKDEYKQMHFRFWKPKRTGQASALWPLTTHPSSSSSSDSSESQQQQQKDDSFPWELERDVQVYVVDPPDCNGRMYSHVLRIQDTELGLRRELIHGAILATRYGATPPIVTQESKTAQQIATTSDAKQEAVPVGTSPHIGDGTQRASAPATVSLSSSEPITRTPQQPQQQQPSIPYPYPIGGNGGTRSTQSLMVIKQRAQTLAALNSGRMVLAPPGSDDVSEAVEPTLAAGGYSSVQIRLPKSAEYVKHQPPENPCDSLVQYMLQHREIVFLVFGVPVAMVTQQSVGIGSSSSNSSSGSKTSVMNGNALVVFRDTLKMLRERLKNLIYHLYTLINFPANVLKLAAGQLMEQEATSSSTEQQQQQQQQQQSTASDNNNNNNKGSKRSRSGDDSRHLSRQADVEVCIPGSPDDAVIWEMYQSHVITYEYLIAYLHGRYDIPYEAFEEEEPDVRGAGDAGAAALDDPEAESTEGTDNASSSVSEKKKTNKSSD